MSFTKSGGKWIVMIGVIVLATWSWKVQMRIQKLEQEIVTKEMEFSMMQLQNELHAPSEMLYVDSKICMEIAALRMKSYTNYGVTTYLPYINLVSSNSGMSYNNSREFSADEGTGDYLGLLYSSSPEHYWLNHLYRPCLNLVGQIDRNDGLGAYLKQHPEQFDKHIRPLIVRLLDAYEPYVSLNACEVLLAMGDRSDELTEIVAILSRSGSIFYKEERVVKPYQLDIKPYEKATVHDDAIRRVYPEWPRVHELTRKLKAKYPVVRGTNIRHGN